MNAQIVMQLFGAANYQDCTDVMLATDGRVLDGAVQVADKLGIEIRQIPVPDGVPAHGSSTDVVVDQGAWTFDRIWAQHVMHLAGRVLARGNGTTNEVVSVDWSGLSRRTSNGSLQTIDIEIFRWTIERLLSGHVVLREEINDRYPKRASSGVVLILGSTDLFEPVKVGSKVGLRLKE